MRTQQKKEGGGLLYKFRGCELSNHKIKLLTAVETTYLVQIPSNVESVSNVLRYM